MAADVVFFAVGADHHGKGVPAHQTFDLAFDLLIARESRLLAYVDGVHIRRVRCKRHLHAGSQCPIANFLQNPGRQPRLALFYDSVEGLNPFPNLFEFVDVWRRSDWPHNHNIPNLPQLNLWRHVRHTSYAQLYTSFFVRGPRIHIMIKDDNDSYSE